MIQKKRMFGIRHRGTVACPEPLGAVWSGPVRDASVRGPSRQRAPDLLHGVPHASRSSNPPKGLIGTPWAREPLAGQWRMRIDGETPLLESPYRLNKSDKPAQLSYRPAPTNRSRHRLHRSPRLPVTSFSTTSRAARFARRRRRLRAAAGGRPRRRVAACCTTWRVARSPRRASVLLAADARPERRCPASPRACEPTRAPPSVSRRQWRACEFGTRGVPGAGRNAAQRIDTATTCRPSPPASYDGNFDQQQAISLSHAMRWRVARLLLVRTDGRHGSAHGTQCATCRRHSSRWINFWLCRPVIEGGAYFRTTSLPSGSRGGRC